MGPVDYSRDHVRRRGHHDDDDDDDDDDVYIRVGLRVR